MHDWTPDGRPILDGAAGFWCVNAGHGGREISETVAAQIATMDYAPPFQMGRPLAFELANALVARSAAHGAEFTYHLERLVALHDASTIAAVIVELIAGSTGALLPPTCGVLVQGAPVHHH